MSRTPIVSRLALLSVSAVALPTLFACLDHPLKGVNVERASEDQSSIALSINKDVDILFIIDNSGSMGEEQANLAANFETMMRVLEAEDVRANYRIGITTTDNGNPICAPGAEAGALVLSSCRSRLNDFLFMGAMPLDRQSACLDNCMHEQIEILPTTTRQDPNPKPRRWLESVDGETNIGGGVSAVEALKCVGPQGINGCGFESHLESMWKALYRATSQDDPAYGFIRDNAILSIIFVTDEVDCSYNDAHASIFSRSSNKVFWTNPDDEAPTSAVCWNAGVTCTNEQGGMFESCEPANKDIDGNPVDDDDAESEAVLRPLKRYFDIVDKLEQNKQKIDPNQQVLVAAISGVPEQYPNVDIQYINGQGGAMQAGFVESFGIGPGCVSSVAEAVPPVRLRAFAEHYQTSSDDVNLFSVCNTDYGPALQAIADKIRDQIRPACMPACVADSDPSTQNTLEPQCVLSKRYTLEDGDTITRSIPKCVNGALPNGEHSCYIELTGDEMDEQCIEEGWNLQFQLLEETDPDIPPYLGSSVTATCQLSQNRGQDCPGLP